MLTLRAGSSTKYCPCYINIMCNIYRYTSIHRVGRVRGVGIIRITVYRAARSLYAYYSHYCKLSLSR